MLRKQRNNIESFHLFKYFFFFFMKFNKNSSWKEKKIKYLRQHDLRICLKKIVLFGMKM